MDEETQKTRKRLKGIWSVEEFNDLLERTMLSTEEKQILILYYKEQKTLTYFHIMEQPVTMDVDAKAFI